MKIARKVLFVFVAVCFAGCVSSGEYNAKLNDIQNLKSGNAALESRIKDKEKENTLLKDNIVTLNGSIKEKESETEVLKKNVATLQEGLKRTGEEKAELEDKHAKLSKGYEELTKKGDELTAENLSLKNTLDAKKDELTKQVMALKEKTRLLEDDVLSKSAQIAALKTETNKQKTDMTALEEKLKKQEAEKTAGDAKLSAGEIQIKQLNNELQSKTVAIADLKKEIKDISTDKAKAIEEKEKAVAELKKTYDNLVSELNVEIKKGEIAVTQLRDKLTLQMVEKILFDSGSADIKGSGKKVLDRVADVLQRVKDKQIRIEGYTDNVPIGPKIAKKFPTNWELSTARATNVVRHLREKSGIDTKLLSAAGYAENNPVELNDTEEGRAKNRRIEIVLIPLEFDKAAPQK